MRLVSHCILVLLLCCLGHGAARADDAQGDRVPAAYKQAIERAIDEFQQNNYQEAREQFARAHALYPNARSLRGLGMSEFELRNYVDAVSNLELALASSVRSLDGTLRSETEALLARARGYVGSLRLRLQPQHAALSVDGFHATLNPYGEIRLGIGDHTLELRAEGYLIERRNIKLRGEQQLELEIVLTRASAASDDAQSGLAPHDQAASMATPLYKRWWLWTLVGAAVVGGTVAAVLLAQPKATHDQALITANTPDNATIEPWRF
jgi:tetratricopeptide (TPR) repeat protein